MTLGSILDADQGLPLAGRKVTFHVTTRKDPTKPRQHEVHAVLYPVTDPDRRLAWDAAKRHLRASGPYKSTEGQPDKPIPADELESEFGFQFLRMALHDGEGNRLVDVDAYERFRLGLVRQQVEQLFFEYDLLIQTEYPEVMTEKQRDKILAELAGEALGK